MPPTQTADARMGGSAANVTPSIRKKKWTCAGPCQQSHWQARKPYRCAHLLHKISHKVLCKEQASRISNTQKAVLINALMMTIQ